MLLVVSTCAFALPAAARSVNGFCVPVPKPCDIGDLVVITGSASVSEYQSADNVVILNGDAIQGRVRGTLFAVNGDVAVTGHVDHDVVALNGTVVVAVNPDGTGVLTGGCGAATSAVTSCRGEGDHQQGRRGQGEHRPGRRPLRARAQLVWVGRIVLWIATAFCIRSVPRSS